MKISVSKVEQETKSNILLHQRDLEQKPEEEKVRKKIVEIGRSISRRKCGQKDIKEPSEKKTFEGGI